MKRCKKCSNLLENYATKCSVCGEILTEQENFEDVTTTLCADSFNEDIGIAFKKKKTLILFSLFLGFLGGCWFYLQKLWHGLITLAGSLLLIAGCLVFGLLINNTLSPLYYVVLVLIPIFSINMGFTLYFVLLGKLNDKKGLPLK